MHQNFHWALFSELKKEEPSFLAVLCGSNYALGNQEFPTRLNSNYLFYRCFDKQMASLTALSLVGTAMKVNAHVEFLSRLPCTDMNLTWLNAVMSQTKLLWLVLTQRDVCTTPCWLSTEMSNRSDIHSSATVTLTFHSWTAGVLWWITTANITCCNMDGNTQYH